ncbi:MAG: DUF4321 domain-containing protein [Clostridia bacterium]
MKKFFIFVFILIGCIIGISLGENVTIDSLKWLSLGGQVGFDSVTIDLAFLKITFGFWCKLNICGVIFLILFSFLSTKISKWIKI